LYFQCFFPPILFAFVSTFPSRVPSWLPQVTRPRPLGRHVHQPVLRGALRGRAGLRRRHNLHVRHDGQDISKQCGDCFGERGTISVQNPENLFLSGGKSAAIVCRRRAAWRSSQDWVSSWARRSGAGSTSRLDTRSRSCFSEVSSWLWFPSTYTSCRALVAVSTYYQMSFQFIF